LRSALGGLRAVAEALRWARRGSTDVDAMQFPPTRNTVAELPPELPPALNPFRVYLDGKHEGPGIWKWLHYCDIYERHLGKFRGLPVTIVEIGIYSGGSIDMWRSCLGPDCRVIGVDIESACRSYERPGVEIEIGDQADPAFWRDFFARHPQVDIIIDDGGHQVHQQAPTLAAVLPHLVPGGGVPLRGHSRRRQPLPRLPCRRGAAPAR